MTSGLQYLPQEGRSERQREDPQTAAPRGPPLLSPACREKRLRDPDRVGWSLRVSPRNSRARGLPFMVPCAGTSGGPHCRRLQLRGDPGEAGGSSRDTRSPPYAPPAGARWSAGVLLERRAAEAVSRGEGPRGRSLGAPRPPPIPPPAARRPRAPRWRPESSTAARAPRSRPRSLPPRHFLGPGPDQLPWYFQNCRGQASLCCRGPRARAPVPRPVARPRIRLRPPGLLWGNAQGRPS